MAYNSGIEWTETTWNPVRGCTKVSAGCTNCYAERFAERFRGVQGHPFEQGFDLRIVDHKLEEPLHWREPRIIFVNSMSDLFHDGVPDAYIRRVADVMMRANWHRYQVLTKRSGRLCALLNSGQFNDVRDAAHIWWGVTVENRKHGLPRLRDLRNAHARNKFLSIEPLLEDLGQFEMDGIGWIIVGGESGPGARPMLEEWVTPIRDRCRAAKVPFFFKQWGGIRKKENGKVLQGRTYCEQPSTMRTA